MDATGRTPAGFYRAAEVARMLRCSEWWVKEQGRQRRIPFCWIGGGYLFTDEHVAATVRLFEVRPAEASGPVGLTPRAASHPDATRADAPGRLKGRTPRRARQSDTRTTAA